MISSGSQTQSDEKAVQLEVDFTASATKSPRPAATPACSKHKKGSSRASAGENTLAPGLEEDAPNPAPRKSRRRGREANPLSAKEMAAKQRDISVSEFFSKNRHLLGFDNPSKALLTTVKEAVDNSLDACEEAGILPDLQVEIKRLSEERYVVAVQDNGPGIVKSQVPRIFGRLLYGSKFHSLKQSRGQQGIGISAAGMYGLLTTGKPIRVISRTSRKSPAHLFELVIDTVKNEPELLVNAETEWDLDHGTRVEITLQGVYKKGRHSVDGYLKQIAIANPHARITYFPPEPEPGPVLLDRVTSELPPDPIEIKPHPHGVELGMLLKMLKGTREKQIAHFLNREFSRVSPRAAADILDDAGLLPKTRPLKLSNSEAERLHSAMAKAKIMAPPADCVSPIGEELLFKALQQDVEADFYTSVTRPPSVYRGNPFQIEVGIAYGGRLQQDETITLYRYANRVPLQYQQSACAITKAVLSIDWKKYHLSQAKGAFPAGPLILIVHIASVWVPFTSESKEAVAHYPEIVREMRLALQEAGRRVGVHIGRVRRAKEEGKKRSYIQRYIPHIGYALQEILGFKDPERDRTIEILTDVLEKSRTQPGE